MWRAISPLHNTPSCCGAELNKSTGITLCALGQEYNVSSCTSSLFCFTLCLCLAYRYSRRQRNEHSSRMSMGQYESRPTWLLQSEQHNETWVPSASTCREYLCDGNKYLLNVSLSREQESTFLPLQSLFHLESFIYFKPEKINIKSGLYRSVHHNYVNEN
jgi:hypothetical protein